MAKSVKKAAKRGLVPSKQFDDQKKRKILAEIKAAPHGGALAILEREGITRSTIGNWRVQLGGKNKRKTTMASNAPRTKKNSKRRRRAAVQNNSGADEVAALRNEVVRLQDKLSEARRIILNQLLGSL